MLHLRSFFTANWWCRKAAKASAMKKGKKTPTNQLLTSRQSSLRLRSNGPASFRCYSAGLRRIHQSSLLSRGWRTAAHGQGAPGAEDDSNTHDAGGRPAASTSKMSRSPILQWSKTAYIGNVEDEEPYLCTASPYPSLRPLALLDPAPWSSLRGSTRMAGRRRCASSRHVLAKAEAAAMRACWSHTIAD